ncbi:beta-glucosidase [Sphingomonas sp. HITSZ_GF]|uniref:beta-glucosidase family protein n=1 Tax=Sphingomonas sp. HITSZ_GF TaxID=3037247 RepID=UPI00240E374E|nr:glycoside hydrolase family 3 protein [Sphingomonas sp. HITSZ_GF]MDG2535995.1 beta-glucosidase [Sphingomonas sp. HITSZ_GF]
MQVSLRHVARSMALLATTALVGPIEAAAQEAVAAVATGAADSSTNVAAHPWSDPKLPVAARAEMLLAAMTLEEKLALVYTWFPPLAKDPAAPTDMIPSAGQQPAIPRLGIPALRETDASLGVANQVEQRKGDTATALPSGLALAASFDPGLAYESGAMIGGEARAKRFNVMLAGGINLTRDPWGGRNFEYLGEDPLLAGAMAGESIRGIQSNRIVSTIKHYALNAQETGRFVSDAKIGEAAFRESDLLAFELAIERGKPGSVMCAYMSVNGDFACENAFLLNSVLKGDWAYPGWVMSDWGAVHSTVKAARNGLDQQSGGELDTHMFFRADLKAAVENGALPMARLDDMARRILHGMFSAGVMDAPVVDTPQPIDSAKNAQVAQRAAEAGIVLLKNEKNLLPLASSAKRIVLIGGHADVGVLSGGGSSQVRSNGGAPVEIPLKDGAPASFSRMTWHASSPLAAIRALAPNATVTYLDGSDPAAAAAAARAADLALVFATQWTTEAADPDQGIALPGDQNALVEAVVAGNRRTVVVLETGGPVLMPWLDKVPAVLAAWYPGQRGGEAIARVLFGEVNPSGRLPITFPASVSQAPRPVTPGIEQVRNSPDHGTDARAIKPFVIDYQEGSDVGYRWYARQGHKPAFPFGYGLSYTRFAYANLKVEGGAALKVSFDVTNSGKREGADVPQLYVTPASGSRPLRLAGFERVTLKPGETRRVTLIAEPRIVADYDTAQPGWHLAAGTYRVAIARDAGQPVLTGAADLQERRLAP